MLRSGPVKKAGLAALGCGALAAVHGCGSGVNTNALNAITSANTASQQGVAAPAALGYAWDGTDRSLRPILGIVGSSRVGASVVPAGAYTNGAASPLSLVALLIRPSGAVDRVVIPSTTTFTLSGVTASPSAAIHFSHSGTYAVIFAPGAPDATLLSNLTTIPKITSLHASSAMLDAEVSDSGNVAVLQKQGDGAQAAVLTSGGSHAIASLTGSGAIDFLPKSDTLLVADASGNALSVIANSTGSPSTQVIPTGGLLKSPVGVSGGASGRWVAVANGGESSVTRIDLSGATAPLRIACPLQPTQVDPLTGDANFRFSDVGSTPAWISDMAVQTPAMFFVPAVAPGA